MVVTKTDLYPNDTMGMENKTVVVTTILVMMESVTVAVGISKSTKAVFSELLNQNALILVTWQYGKHISLNTQASHC